MPRGFHYAAGDALAHIGQTADAEREFEAEIAADPHDVQPYADLALLQIMRRDRAAALQTIDRMAAANPSRDTFVSPPTASNDGASMKPPRSGERRLAEPLVGAERPFADQFRPFVGSLAEHEGRKLIRQNGSTGS